MLKLQCELIIISCLYTHCTTTCSSAV